MKIDKQNALFSMAAGKVWAIHAYLKEYGIEERSFLRDCGVDPSFFDHPDNRITTEHLDVLVKGLFEKTGDDNLGLHLGRLLRPFPNILGYLVMNCRNIGEALRKYINYQDIVDEVYRLHLEEKDGSVVLYSNSEAEFLDLDQHHAAFRLTSIFSYISQISDCDLKRRYLREVRFMHASPDDTEEYDDFFGLIPVFSAPENALVFSEDILDLPVPFQNPELLELFEARARTVLEELHRGGEYSFKVRRIIVDNLRADVSGVESVAAALALSVRSLQEKLRREKTSYSALLRDVRRSLAVSYLGEKALSISEIAYLLGFSEVSVFHREFRKWTGITPGRYRTENPVLTD